MRTIQTLVAALALGTIAITGGVARADDVKIPVTTADHEVLAKSYQEKAASYRKESDSHKEMAAAYGKAHADSKGGVKNPWNQKMQKHCQAMATAAEKLAKEAEKAAEFHTLRAKETQGK